VLRRNLTAVLVGLAVPIAMVVTCLVRGDLARHPDERDLSGPNLIRKVVNISLGALIGCAVAKTLATLASAFCHRFKKNERESEN
jgi:hypothetical protein